MESYITSGPADNMVTLSLLPLGAGASSRYPRAMKRSALSTPFLVGFAVFACGGGDEQVGSNEEGASPDDTTEVAGTDTPTTTDAEQPSESAADTASTDAAGPATGTDTSGETNPDLSESLDDALGDDMSVDLGMTPASVGAECESDEECGDGVVCLKEEPAFSEGQIAKGMCTMRCEQDPAVCGSTALCIGVGQDTEDTSDDVGYCYEACLVGNPNEKCSDSLNRACSLIDPETYVGVCDPLCFSDAECGDGLSCSPAFPWLCVEEVPDDLLPDGATCLAHEECLGGSCMYIDETSTDGVCVSACSLQFETYACRRDLGDTTPVDSACFPLLGLVWAGAMDFGQNDLGQCLQTCDVSEDCEHAEWDCLPLDGDPAFADDVGHTGICLPNLLLMGEPAVEDMGMGGASGSDGGVAPADDTTDTMDEMLDDMGMGGAPAVDGGAN